MSRTPTPSPTHRSRTTPTRPDAASGPDGVPADRPRRLPGLATQAATVALVPALLWAAAHPALVATAVVTAAVTAVAVTAAHRRRAPAGAAGVRARAARSE